MPKKNIFCYLNITKRKHEKEKRLLLGKNIE
jgi:hypothetical protein